MCWAQSMEIQAVKKKALAACLEVDANLVKVECPGNVSKCVKYEYAVQVSYRSGSPDSRSALRDILYVPCAETLLYAHTAKYPRTLQVGCELSIHGCFVSGFCIGPLSLSNASECSGYFVFSSAFNDSLQKRQCLQASPKITLLKGY